ncbi:MAG: N-6 DNA methylase [Capsulimonadaceae bacterium]|nr:N-6 DNA methylase [Capsulimonadaceae bacterium]
MLPASSRLPAGVAAREAIDHALGDAIGRDDVAAAFHRLIARIADGDPACECVRGAPRALGDAYAARQATLLDPSQVRRVRKHAGLYYTPPALVDALLCATLDPVLDEAERSADPLRAMRAIRVCDPACGAGHFLAEAVRRISERFAELGGYPADALDCVFGVDIDPVAAAICRVSVWLASGGCGTMPRAVDERIVISDSLAPEMPQPLAAGAFDVVVGNPPFVNGIEGGSTVAAKTAIRSRWPDMAGTLDLSGAFLRLSADLVRPGGRIGLIQPLIALSSRSLASFRANPPKGLNPNLILIPARSSLFRQAAVFVCALALGPGPECVVVQGDQSRRHARISGADWWASISDSERPPSSVTVGDVFDIRASMTVGEAYDAARFVREERPGDTGPKLLTTGLIDPARCFWGERPCRYLGETYARPRFALEPGVSTALERRVEQASRPKILVAGLSRRIEALVDDCGEYMGAVSTFSICHPNDDRAALRALCDYLHTDAAHIAYLANLGAYRVGGGDITMRKAFLKGLALPDGPQKTVCPAAEGS